MNTPNPGSPAAVAAGCLCPQVDNHNGRGQPLGGIRQFWRNADCPLHGARSLTDSAAPTTQETDA